jgi:hypothetical protein
MRAARAHLQTLDQITPVLLRYNEEQNISRTLSHHLAWVKDIVVIDRGRPSHTFRTCASLTAVSILIANSGAERDYWVRL